MSLGHLRAFKFTESRIEEAIRLVRDGRIEASGDGRRLWRDEGSTHGLYLRVGRQGATFYRIAKVAGRKTATRIGDATVMPLAKARQAALRLAGGDRDAAAAPIRVRTDGITVAAAWKAYIADSRSGEFVAGRKPAAQSTLDSYVGLFTAHLEKPYAKKSLHALAKDVQAIHRKLKAKPVTANRLLQVISNLFVHAARTGNWEKPNPALDPITGRTIRKYSVKARERFLTTAEAAKVIAYALTEPDPWCDFWRLLILTGVRVANLREMKWGQLDLRDTASFWSIPKTKNGDPHIVPLSAQAVAILRERLARSPKAGDKGKAASRPVSEWVFPMKEDSRRCITDCDHAWGRVRKNAPIDDARIHDLRRTAGSWATQAGAPISAVGKFIGDKSINATAVYARADTASARQVADLVEQRLREATGGNK
jgi:integrase